MTTINDTTPVSATWWTSSGSTDSTHWLPPEDGYIRIDIGEALTLSIEGSQALQLLFYLTGDSAIDVESLPTSPESLIVWEEDDGSVVILLEFVRIIIGTETRDRLVACLRRILRDSPFYRHEENNFDWKKEGF